MPVVVVHTLALHCGKRHMLVLYVGEVRRVG